MHSVELQQGDSLSLARQWGSPVVIVADGPYGVSGYDGDLTCADDLADWYEPHVALWAEKSTPLTTLWFWNTEVGWAEVHPVLKKHGWVYRSCNIWNKGIGHIAGNSNTKTLRRFPVVTEVCAHYVRRPVFVNENATDMTAQLWLRSEWGRTGLSFSLSNDACEVRNAATRKYLTADHLWYFPPANVFEKLVQYANKHGDPQGSPYFAIDGSVVTGSQWEQLRGKFFCPPAVTNVWNVPAVRGTERIKIDGRALHPNQKPLSLMDRIIAVSSEEDDVIWEPFGGLCTASLVAFLMGRKAFAAEIDATTFAAAKARIRNAEMNEQSVCFT
jgi:hypothetical protein